MRHLVQWTAPAPFWTSAPDRSDALRLAMRRPALLRFASDAFMDQFNQTLATDPPKLRDLEAAYETWKKPAGSPVVVNTPARAATTAEKKLARLRVTLDRKVARLTGGATALLEEDPSSDPPPLLKIYQPAHQRYYLVTAALVCRLPGLPDRAINGSNQEKAAFVLRRVRTTGTGTSAVSAEYGFVPSGTGGTWTLIAQPDTTLAEGEERLPLFTVNFADDEGNRRRVMAGLVPAGKREVYVGSPEGQPPHVALPPLAGDLAEPGGPTPPIDPRIALLSAEVIDPWKALTQQADRTGQTLRHQSNVDSGEDLNPIKAEARETMQVGSWYILLDLARFLSTHLRPVFDALPNATAAGLTDAEAEVWNALDVTLPAGIQAVVTAPAGSPWMLVKTSLRQVLHAIDEDYGTLLEAAANRFDRSHPSAEWPDFLFPLMDIPSADNGFNGVTLDATPVGPVTMTDLQKALRRLSAFRDLVAAALPETPTGPVPDLPIAAQPVMAPDERAVFVIRCVLERPDCGEVPLISAPSQPFEIAGFFDPDAPARPIRIALPVDTSPAGLRRAPKNAAFMMSDILCGQVNRAKGMGFIDLVLSVLPWPLHKDLSGGSSACKTDDPSVSVGMICSLSIPIITICALILLIIMVSLLDIIFRWLPYLIFCFPLPKFSGKSGSQA